MSKLTTAFESLDIDRDAQLLARALRGYHFNFKIYAGEFPSCNEEPLRAYDGAIIIADGEKAGDLVGRIRETMNPEEIIVTREALIGTKKVFAKPIL